MICLFFPKGRVCYFMQVETRRRQRRAEVALPTEGNNPARAQTLLGPPGTGKNPPGHPHVNGASEFFKNDWHWV